MADGPDRIVATITKNDREDLRIALNEYQGRSYASMRIWYMDRAGEMKPGRQGLAVGIDKLPDLIAGLNALQAHARAAGLL